MPARPLPFSCYTDSREHEASSAALQTGVVSRDDSLLVEIARLRSLLPRKVAQDYVGLAARIVEGVAALGAEASLDQVFRHGSAEELAAGPDREPSLAGAAAKGPGDLRFIVIDGAAGGSEYRYHVVRHREGRPYFRRVGQLALVYTHSRMTPSSAAFARLLLVAMRALQAPPPAASEVERWRTTVDGLVARSGAARRIDWTVEWTPDAL